MEITSSGVSVYEVELNLNQWEGLLTNQVPGFMSALVSFMPSTQQHKCMSGNPGGFHEELAKGTNFGHVVEHVLLELIRLTDHARTEYSGWTKALGGGRYVIHYGAPGFLTGRLAAILAVEIVGKLQKGEKPDLESYVQKLSNPLEYFTRERSQTTSAEEPHYFDVADGLDPQTLAMGREPAPTLSDWQRDNLVRTLTAMEDSFSTINQNWENAFFAFGGDFARGIVDKIELINPDKFQTCYIKGDFDACFQGVANFSQMMRSLGIPLNFVTHSIWLYKNFMQLVVLDSFAKDPEAQTATTWDFDDYFQNIFHAILTGYSRPVQDNGQGSELALSGFRARHARCGTVLVVDDDVMARKVARNILEYRGFKTAGARDGVEALSILANRGGEIGVVLLDLVMPGMAGQVVCRRIRDSCPTVRIILCSGFPLDEGTSDCLDEHEVSFLSKPFSSAELINSVSDLMDLWVTGNGHPNPAALPPKPLSIESENQNWT